jgi:hypothetical protein
VTTTSRRDIINSAKRALDLARDLDKVRDAGAIGQIASGLQHELHAVLLGLSAQESEAIESVAGDRPGKVRADARPTSRAAAVQVKSGTDRHRILVALHAQGGQTDHELQGYLSMDQNTERPRRGELVDSGYVMATEVTRQHGGRDWTVWEITDLGFEVWAALSGEVDPPRRSGPQSLF